MVSGEMKKILSKEMSLATAGIVSILWDNEIIFGFNLLFELIFIPLLKSQK